MYKAYKFDPTNKEKATQPSKLTLVRQDANKPDNALEKQAEMNKLNNLHAKPMVSALNIESQDIVLVIVGDKNLLMWLKGNMS